MNNINFTYSQLLYQWLSKIAPTYRGVLPAGVNPEGAYFRFDGYLDNIATPFVMAVSIYAPNTTSYSTVIQLADRLADAIGDAGVVIGNEFLKIKIEKGSPFYQDKPDEDLTIRAGYVNLALSVYAVSAKVKYKVSFVDYRSAVDVQNTSWATPRWYKSGDTVDIPANDYAHLGYYFYGWNDKASGEVYRAGDTFTVVNADVNLVAEWRELIVYTITFIASDKVVAEIEYDAIHKDITTPAVPVKSGYIGQWEYFDLTYAEYDFTVNAVYTARPTVVYSGQSFAGQKTHLRSV